MSGPATPPPAPPAMPSPPALPQHLVEPLTVAGSLVATALSLLCVWRLVHKAKSKNDIALGWDRVQHGLLTALPGFVIAVLDVYSDLHLYNDLTSEQQTSTSGALILMFVAFSSIFIGLKLVFDGLYVSNGWKPLEQCGCDNKEARWSTTVFVGGLSALLYLFLVPDGNPKDIVEQIDQELNIEDDDDDDDVKLSDAPPPAEPAKGAAAAAGVADQKSPFSWSALGALAFIAIMPLLITSMELSITYYALPVLGAIIVPCVEIYSDNKQGGGGTYLGKTALFAKPFYSKNRVLAKTGSGQT